MQFSQVRNKKKQKKKMIILNKYRNILSPCLFLALVLVSLIGCKPRVPSEFIDEKDMAKILYDYHLADAMSNEVAGGNKQWHEMQASVLKKHGVTQAKFDTSMTYYFRHSDKLEEIYRKVAERLSNEAEAQGLAVSDLNTFGAISHSGDTASIWEGSDALVLAQNKPFNIHRFNIECDSSFHKGDNILFSMDANFLVQEGTRDAAIGLNIEYENDSTASNIVRLYSSNNYSLKLDDNNYRGLRKVRGFIILNNDMESTPKTTLHLLMLSNIRLIRIHNTQEKEEVSE